jgi:hypothetical protein
MMLGLFNIFNFIRYGLHVVVIFDFMWSDIWAGFGPVWPNKRHDVV